MALFLVSDSLLNFQYTIYSACMRLSFEMEIMFNDADVEILNWGAIRVSNKGNGNYPFL